jgi:hypothetical protein
MPFYAINEFTYPTIAPFDVTGPGREQHVHISQIQTESPILSGPSTQRLKWPTTAFLSDITDAKRQRTLMSGWISHCFEVVETFQKK